jgi:predicted Zn-dependent protease
MKQGTREAAETWNALAREKLGHDIIIIDAEYEHDSAQRALNNRHNDIFSTELNEYEKVTGQDWLGICVSQQRSYGFYVDVSFAPENKIYSWAAGFMDKAYYFIALHEFGHAVGLGHIDNDAELMYGSPRRFADAPHEITPAAVDVFCEVHGCE